jgi:hypothetical protein
MPACGSGGAAVEVEDAGVAATAVSAWRTLACGNDGVGVEVSCVWPWRSPASGRGGFVLAAAAATVWRSRACGSDRGLLWVQQQAWKSPGA